MAALSACTREAPVPAHAALALRLHDFRNYPHLRLEVGSGRVVLHGDNGAGKTNLLEAVSLLAPGRGLRQARPGELDRRDGGAWSLVAQIHGRDGPAEVLTARHADGDRRIVRLDGGAERSPNALADLVSLVWLTPAMDRLFLEGGSGRRRFLDRLVLAVQPDHGARVSLYERTLRERSALLRHGRADPAWLAALERRTAEAGVALAAARRELLAGLNRVLAADGLPFPRPLLAVEDEVGGWLEAMPAVDAEQRFAAALQRSRSEDAHTGGAAIGPHRADLAATDAATGEPARLCSTGRQKAFLVSIVLAEARLRLLRHGDLPVLLLDEIAAHLDAERRTALLEDLDRLGAQCWLTGTDAALFQPLRGRAQFFRVHQATLTADD
ncbi:MAG TPA: DNA replication/repair protein RecF [Geminicoccaceae bacterium]|nr:DNA replication/repair protein RecF [Geminicoccaceae bacterium]